VALFAGAGVASAQVSVPVGLDPSVAGQGTALVIAADASLLSRDGRAARSIGFALARGMRVDPGAVGQLCTRREAARSACPLPSRIGFGLFGLDVRGYELGTGATRLTWGLDAYLGEPQRRGDAASVVLIGRLLGADLIATLLSPTLGTPVPNTTTSIGRLVRRGSGRYGVELQFAQLPVKLKVAAPVTATPAQLELSLNATRRTRQNFTRTIKVPTPSGFEIRKIHDHRLVGQYLLRTPSSCNGSWPSEIRVGFPGRVVRSQRAIACTKTL
jgi:hypothetical protein